MKRQHVSADAARRIALAAQGFAGARPEGTANAGHVKRAIDRLGLLQIDSVNVLNLDHGLRGLAGRAGLSTTCFLSRDRHSPI